MSTVIFKRKDEKADMMKTAIVTDTNSGISNQEAEKEGIFLIPMPVIIQETSYLEKIDIQTEQLYEAMERGEHISTSQPSPEAIMKLWDSIFEQGYDALVYIPMTSGLSGSCQTAQMLADDYEEKVFVADNHRISVTQRASVLAAKRMADAGKSAAEIKKILEEHAFDASIYLTVESLKYLQRGGRLSASAAMLGTILNIKPILSIQGEQIEAFAKVRGSKKCEHKMLEAIQHDIEHRFSDVPPEKIEIQIAGTLQKSEDIARWKTIIQETFPLNSIEYFPLPCSIAAHVGPGCFGIAVCVAEC